MSQEINRRLVLAAFFIIIGIFLLLNNLGLVPPILLPLFSWPMILIIIGTFILLTKRELLPSLIFIGIGMYFLLPDFFDFDFYNIWVFWPVIIIAIGMSFLLRNRGPQRRSSSGKSGSEHGMEYIDELSIFSGGEKIVTSKNFKGGKITNIFGGTEINLLNSNLAKGTNYIDIVNLFGGSTLIIPSNWNVKIDMVSLFGGFADKRDYRSTSSDPSDQELYIKGVTLFGGGEIKSYK